MTVYEKYEGVAEENGITTTYLYGQGLICEEREGNYLYHHYNNLGSTMKLTDAAGAVKAGFTYGTYGELLSGDSSLTHFLYNGRCGVSTDANGLYYMRQRYYNPEIKRFINQDILTGSTDNSQSLNRYSYVQGNPVSYTDPFGLSPANGLYTGTSVTHTVLGLLGMVPGLIGATANFIDGLVYAFVDRDLGMAALCFTDAATFGVTKHATNLIQANKYVTTAKALLSATRVVSNSLSFGVLANNVMKTGTLMYEKYYIQGQSVDSNTKWEVANIVLSTVGSVLSGRGMAKGVNELGDMLRTKGFVNGLKDDMLQFANNVKNRIPKLDNGGYLNRGAISNTTMDHRLVTNSFFDNGERIATTNQIRNYKKQMKSKGINVIVDQKGKVLTGNKAAGFDYDTGTVYIKKQPGVIDLYHEGFHVEQYLNIGKENYISLGRLAREEYVYGRIMDNSSLFNEFELQGAINYINKLRGTK